MLSSRTFPALQKALSSQLIVPYRDSLLARTKTEDVITQLYTNLLGSMLTCKAAMKTMIQQQRGSIVNVGSIIGLKGNAGQSVYSASKEGIFGFSRALAKE